MMAEASPLRVAVVGCGVFGRNHARVYRQLQQENANVEFVGVVDTDAVRVQKVAQEFAARPLSSVAELRGKIDAASVAVPTVQHLAVARELMQAGAHVLIEKPLAASLEEANELIALASRTERVAQAGHLERFNPAV